MSPAGANHDSTSAQPLPCERISSCSIPRRLAVRPIARTSARSSSTQPSLPPSMIGARSFGPGPSHTAVSATCSRRSCSSRLVSIESSLIGRSPQSVSGSGNSGRPLVVTPSSLVLLVSGAPDAVAERTTEDASPAMIASRCVLVLILPSGLTRRRRGRCLRGCDQPAGLINRPARLSPGRPVVCSLPGASARGRARSESDRLDRVVAADAEPAALAPG